MRRHPGVMGISPLMLLLPPFGVTGILWMSSPNASEPLAVVYAFLLLLMPWGSFLCWRHGERHGLPVFPLVAGAYWVFFGLALLWGSRELYLTGAYRIFVPPESLVTATMALVFAGVVALWMGMRVPVVVWAPAHLPDIVDHPRTWVYVRVVLLAGVCLKLYSESAWLFGAGGRQAMTTLTTVIPNVAFILLLIRHLDGHSTRVDRVVLLAAVSVLAIGGLASGWLGSVAGILVLYGAVVLLKRRQIPWLPIAGTILVILFLQVGKNDFRTQYWGEQTNATLTERVGFWLERSASRWGAAFESGDSGSAQRLASMSLQRASLLPQVAHVLDMTPSHVPFQEGATYRYLAVTFIPRFLWPDKPSVNEANRFYQVEYGLTTERNLEGVSIAVGSLAEGYINFGWFGAVGVMFGIGMILGLYERTFGRTQSGSLFLAIGLALIPGFLTIESQLGQYLGGVVQQAALAAVVFLPITQRRGLGLKGNRRIPGAYQSFPAAPSGR